MPHATLCSTLQDAQQEAADLHVHTDPANQEVNQWSVEDQQAKEDAEKVCMDLQQQLSNVSAAHEAESEDARREVASLKQQLEQAGVTHKAALAALHQNMKDAELQFSSRIWVGSWH